jgi:hypothetical protein
VKHETSSRAVWLQRFFVAAAFAYGMAGAIAVVVMSARVPFADAWQHYARLLDESFPRSVLAAQNGHPEVFANLVRLASLRWLHGDENVQIAIGLILALATLAILLRIAWRVRDIPAPARAALLFTLTLALFWLGNARALLHANETLHVYSVLLCLALALSLLLGQRAASLVRTGAAVALCCVASFNFGSGVAGFVALSVVLVLQRVPLRHFVVVGVGLLATLATYQLLDGSRSVPLSLHPFDQAGLALRWLAAPLIYLFWPFVDPSAAAALPASLAGVGAIARAWTHMFGDVQHSAGPQTVAGLLLVGLLLLATWHAWRRPASTNDGVRLGLALGWFGVAVSALVVLTRLGYFADHPTQLYAPRYLPWSTLSWAGLLASALARTPPARGALAIAAAVGVFALAAECGMTLVMRHERAIADDTALGAVVGIWPDDGGVGETDAEVTRVAAVAMRRVGAGPFAWPEARLIDQPVPATARRVVARRLEVTRPHNRINTDGLRLDAELVEPECRHDRLLVAEHGHVVGLLRRIDGSHWRGAAAGNAAPESLQVFEPGCG